MTKLKKNPINALLEAEATRAQVQKAKDRFQFKPYFQKYAGLKTTANILQVLLPIFSIGTGTLFLSSILSELMPIYTIALMLAISLIALLEYSKAYLVNVSFTDFYTSKLNILAVCFVLLLASASAFTSLQGIKELHKKLDTSLSTLADNQTAQEDSVRNYFDNQIQTTRQELASFKSSITWNGKINMYNQANASTIQAYSKQLEAMQKDKSTALAEGKALHMLQSEATNKESGFNLIVVISIIGLIEVCILLANWFVIYYDYQTAKQAETLTNKASRFTLDLDTLQHTIQDYLSTTGNQFAPQAQAQAHVQSEVQAQVQSSQIGFNVGLSPQAQASQDKAVSSVSDRVKPRLSPLAINKDKQYLEAYKQVVQDIQTGKTQSRILDKVYQVQDVQTGKLVQKTISRSTLQNIKRILRNV
jgi:hypothetical protein